MIRDNVVSGNGFAVSAPAWGAGIQISASSDVQVADNIVTGNKNGIGLVQEDRGTGAYGPFHLDGVTVVGKPWRKGGNDRHGRIMRTT